MDHDENRCIKCSQKDRCGQVYEELGKASGPNVTWKVILAFLVPMLVFIISLAGANKLLEGRFEDETLTAAAFLSAVAVTLIVVFIIRAFQRSSKK